MQSTPKENREPLRNYVSRILVPHTDFQQARRRIRQLIRYRESGGTEPKGLAVMGESRTGKSTVLNAVIEEWPRRRDEDGLVVPILVARVPSRPSIIALAKSLLKALGVPDWNTGTEIELTERLKTLLKKCKVMAIALDEFHHFVDRRSEQVQHELADWLKNLIEEAEVCLIVLGVPRMTAVIRQNEQLEGRFLAPVVLPRFDWFQDEQRADWIGILDAFSITLSEHFDVLDMKDEDIAFRLWCATGGLLGYLAQLLTQAIWDAIDDLRKSISLADLASARKTALFKPLANPAGLPPILGPKPIVCTQELIDAVRRIGVEEPPQRRQRTRSKKASQGPEPSAAARLQAALQ